MTWMQWTDQGFSVLLIMACWWLSHQNAAGPLPFARPMAIAYALLGMMILGNMIIRQFDELRPMLPYTILITKAAFTLVLWMIAARLPIIERYYK